MRKFEGERRIKHMISSIQASGTNIQNYSNTVSALSNTKVSGTKEAETTAVTENEDGITATSAQGDVVNISGKSLKVFSAESANRPSETGTAEDGSYKSAVASAVSSAASDIGITEYTAAKTEAGTQSAAVSSGSSTSSTSSLSGYSEAELKQMLQNGEITQAEYNAEIESRQESEDEDTETDTDNVSAAGSTEA